MRFDRGEIYSATKASGGEYLVLWTREGDWAFYKSTELDRSGN